MADDGMYQNHEEYHLPAYINFTYCFSEYFPVSCLFPNKPYFHISEAQSKTSMYNIDEEIADDNNNVLNSK